MPGRTETAPAARRQPATPRAPRRRRIYLHRSVAVITPERVEIRPALSAALAPLLLLLIGAGAFTLVLLSAMGGNYPLWLVAPALLVALVAVPFAGMGFIYSAVGANVVVDARKGSATWQQGLLGLGVGTQELVPFAKIAGIVLEEVTRADATPAERRREPVLQWDLTLVKRSGRRLTIGMLTVPRSLRREGYGRIRDVGRSVAQVSGATLMLPGQG